MSNYRPVLMIRKAGAAAVTSFATLKGILGTPTVPAQDPEAPPVEAPVANVAEYFLDYHDQLQAVQTVVERKAGDRVTMFPEGYPEDYFFVYIMADKIPGETEADRQRNRETLKAVFDAMTAAGGASWSVRYLSTVPEQIAYIRLLSQDI